MYMSIETSVTMDRLTKSLLKSLLHPYILYLFDKITQVQMLKNNIHKMNTMTKTYIKIKHQNKEIGLL